MIGTTTKIKRNNTKRIKGTPVGWKNEQPSRMKASARKEREKRGRCRRVSKKWRCASSRQEVEVCIVRASMAGRKIIQGRLRPIRGAT